MMKQCFYSIGCVVSILLFASCRTTKTGQKEKQAVDKEVIMESNMEIKSIVQETSAAVRSPKVFVYKTKADYSHLVPVLMDNSRTKIISYPHPRDLVIGGKLCLPTLLNEGYWLDNRGIGRNVAFLTYTYEEYSQLPAAPSMEELMAHIRDTNPITEWHECGQRANYKNIIPELNKLIEQGFLQK